MTMQTIRLDISSDIFDKVMFILENLPKNKVKFSLENKANEHQPQKNNLVDFFQNSPLVDILSLDRDEEVYRGRIEF